MWVSFNKRLLFGAYISMLRPLIFQNPMSWWPPFAVLLASVLSTCEPLSNLLPRKLALKTILLGRSGDLVSQLSNRTYRAYYGYIWWLTGDTNWTYEVN